MHHTIRETRFKEGLGCFHCGSVKVKRNGKYRERQRYLCRDCGKSFNDLSNTPIGSYIDPSSLLCTDTATNYKKFAQIKALKHEPINLSKEGYVKKGIYHLQNVNNYHKRLKGWMDRFQVVAKKYLDNYLYWFSFLQQSKKLAEKEQINQMLLSSCQNPNNITVNFLREV